MDTRLCLMCGTDYPVPECQLVIHQPKLKEISYIGEADFFTGIQSLCVNKSMFIQDETLLSDINNFQIFMTIMAERETADKRFAVEQVNSLFFPEYKILFTPRSMLFSKGGEMIQVDESNFDYLQAAISEICCLKTGPMDQQAFNPANEKARAIAEKLMRGRQRVAAEKGQNNISIFTQYLSTLAIGTSCTLQQGMELTMFQLYDLVERYMLYINWDIDIRCRMAGGTPEGQPDNWMKNIH